MDDLLSMPRRLSAVLVCHTRYDLSSSSTWAAMTRVERCGSSQIGSWTAWRIVYGADRSYVPLEPTHGQRDCLFWHDALILVPSSETFHQVAASVALVVAPYVKLLGSLTSYLADQMGQPQMRFLAVDMKEVFSHSIKTAMVSGGVVQISFDYSGDSHADRFTLKGRDPLSSELVRDLFFPEPIPEKSTTSDDSQLTYRPHGFVLRANKVGFTTNIRCDRFGYIWWFSRNPSAVHNIVPVLEELASMKVFHQSISSPIRRIRGNPDEEDFE